MVKQNYELSCGAILYNKEDNNAVKYLIVKDRNGNYSFPKGHMEEGETMIETAYREVKEECNVEYVADTDFIYSVEYKLNETTTKSVHLFSGSFKGNKYRINDPEIQEIRICNFSEAYNLITFQDYKNALKEVNDKVTNCIKQCQTK